MGVKLNSQDNDRSSKDYVAAISRVTWAAVYRVLNLYLNSNWLWELTPLGAENKRDVKFLHGYTERIISERKATYNSRGIKDKEFADEAFGTKKRQAFLDKLLEMGDSLSDSDIREEVDTFLFEGHDTTAALIEFALFELGQNPDVQELAYEEQLSIFGEDEREATLADLQNMNYLDRVIKECLRLYPSVPYMSRKIAEDVPLKDSLTIPAGSNVVITPYFMHRNPKYFPDPEKFDPDRFLPENCIKRHPFATYRSALDHETVLVKNSPPWKSR
uniref:Cytochrome P450 4C1 n=1 Tax=Lygus hesperus TaxID=30085 RepID=A0A0K8T0R3_LYGHE